MRTSVKRSGFATTVGVSSPRQQQRWDLSRREAIDEDSREEAKSNLPVAPQSGQR